MGKCNLTFICMFLSLAFGFDSYASEHLLPLEESEYQEIVSMRDEILFQMNHGGAVQNLGGMCGWMNWGWRGHIKFIRSQGF